MADTPTAATLKRLAKQAKQLHEGIAAAMVYDATERAMVRAERGMAAVERELAVALAIVEKRGTDG